MLDCIQLCCGRFQFCSLSSQHTGIQVNTVNNTSGVPCWVTLNWPSNTVQLMSAACSVKNSWVSSSGMCPQPHPSLNFKAKLGGLNFVATIFICSSPQPQVRRRMMERAGFPIAIFGTESTGINCTDIIFNCAGPHLEIGEGNFPSSASLSPIPNFGMKMVLNIWFQLCTIVQQ